MAHSTAHTTGANKATTFRLELVEQIPCEVSATDLVLSGAALPSYWRMVLESSRKISKIVTDGLRAKEFESLEDPFLIVELPLNFRCTTGNGSLLGARDSFNHEGFMLVETMREGPSVKLTVLDPSTKAAIFAPDAKILYPRTSKARRRVNRPRFPQLGFIKLRNMRGTSMVSHTVSLSSGSDENCSINA